MHGKNILLKTKHGKFKKVQVSERPKGVISKQGQFKK